VGGDGEGAVDDGVDVAGEGLEGRVDERDGQVLGLRVGAGDEVEGFLAELGEGGGGRVEAEGVGLGHRGEDVKTVAQVHEKVAVVLQRCKVDGVCQLLHLLCPALYLLVDAVDGIVARHLHKVDERELAWDRVLHALRGPQRT